MKYKVYAVVIQDNDVSFENLASSVDSWTELTKEPVDYEESERILNTLDEPNR